MSKPRKYGWRQSQPRMHDRTRRFAATRKLVSATPNSFDLTPQCPPIWDQDQTGDCVEFTSNRLFVFNLMRQGLPLFTPSHLFLYWNTRVIEGTETSDSGSTIDDAIQSLTLIGVCPDYFWPYDETKVLVEPPPAAYAAATPNLCLTSQIVDRDLGQMQACIAGGFPFGFGFSVYDSFESDQVAATGIVPMPQTGEEYQGGHAVTCVGYDRTKKMFLVQNSWGADWGLKGEFWIPFDYLMDENLSDDFKVINSVT